MSDYISREEAKKLLANTLCFHEDLPSLLDTLPAADVVWCKKGRWELDVLDGMPGCRPVAIVCSECHRVAFAATLFCPNCGAEMIHV